MRLNKKNIFVTGIGKGIGRDVFLDCLKEGANVYGICKKKSDLTGLKIKGSKIFIGDVTNKNFINKTFNYFKKNNIKLHGLVNNAGIRQRASFEKITDKELDKVMNVNFFSIFFIIQKFIKFIDKKDNVSVVNLSSIVGKRGFSELSGYASSKAALDGLTKSLSIELCINFKKLRINNVRPGFTKTSFYNNFKSKKKSLYDWTISKTPISRWAETKEISNLIIFLLSNDSTYINGQSINIDGGWTAA